MTFTVQNDNLIIALTGRIDAANVIQTENEITNAINDHSTLIPIFNAAQLTYISSAGLRMLLKISKMSDRRLVIEETCDEVYDIFETTGFVQIFDVRKKLKTISIDGCRVIGSGFFGTVYRLDEETIVKVCNAPDALQSIREEQAMAKAALISGVPTAIAYNTVRVGDGYGAIYELVSSGTFNDIIIQYPDRIDQTIDSYVNFLKLAHSASLHDAAIPTAKDIFLKWTDAIKDYIDEPVYHKLKSLISSMSDSDGFVHGDCQMKNVMTCEGSPIFIDMGTVCKGHPIFDLQSIDVSYILFEEDDPNNAPSFLGITNDTAHYIADRIFELYFSDTDKSKMSQIRKKIRIAALIRYMYLLVTTSLKDDSFGQKRMERTRRSFKELTETTDSLEW